MSEETKKCPFCAEEILAAAMKCKHCGENLTTPAESQTETYETTWPFFYESGPGYWKVKPTYWIGLVIGLVTIPVAGIGFGVLAFLIISNLISRNNWNKNEIVGAIQKK